MHYSIGMKTIKSVILASGSELRLQQRTSFSIQVSLRPIGCTRGEILAEYNTPLSNTSQLENQAMLERALVGFTSEMHRLNGLHKYLK